MQNILILCTGNSCRSQIAEGFLKKIISEKKLDAQACSAGIEAHGLNPRAVKAMNEIGIDISGHKSKTLDELLNSFPKGAASSRWLDEREGAKADGAIDFVITVCDSAKESCPVFPNAKKRMHYSFPDPAKATGTEEEIMSQFRKIRDEIGSFCKEFIEKNIW